MLSVSSTACQTFLCGIHASRNAESRVLWSGFNGGIPPWLELGVVHSIASVACSAWFGQDVLPPMVVGRAYLLFRNVLLRETGYVCGWRQQCWMGHGDVGAVLSCTVYPANFFWRIRCSKERCEAGCPQGNRKGWQTSTARAAEWHVLRKSTKAPNKEHRRFPGMPCHSNP